MTEFLLSEHPSGYCSSVIFHASESFVCDGLGLVQSFVPMIQNSFDEWDSSLSDCLSKGHFDDGSIYR